MDLISALSSSHHHHDQHHQWRRQQSKLAWSLGWRKKKIMHFHKAMARGYEIDWLGDEMTCQRVTPIACATYRYRVGYATWPEFCYCAEFLMSCVSPKILERERLFLARCHRFLSFRDYPLHRRLYERISPLIHTAVVVLQRTPLVSPEPRPRARHAHA